MTCENCPNRSSYCQKNAILPSAKDRKFKIHFSDKVANSVCYERPISYLNIPIFWVILCDKHKIRILSKNAHLHEIGIITPENQPEAHTETYDISYIEDVLAWLEEAAENGCYGRIILSAPPKMLGEIRKHLPAGLATYIVAQLDKDLTKLSEPDLKEELSEILWFA